jgi:N-acetylneuraminic acid mutarotase
MLAFFRPEASSKVRTLSFSERVAYQRAIEDVYWRHRIWPNERCDPKPPLDSVMPQTQLEKKVAEYLRKSQALEDYWQRPITAEQLQTEMDRIAKHTKQPEVLRELFEALGNDPFVIAECLVRPALAEQNLAIVAPGTQRTEASEPTVESPIHNAAYTASANYTLPTISNGPNGCTDDSWTITSTTNAPSPRSAHTGVWTGSEMIVWGGNGNGVFFNTGGRYNPSTDSWTTTSTIDAPEARAYHTAVWTGTEMIVWGGQDSTGGWLNTGGRYNPATDSWTATNITNAPSPRYVHTAVWTSTEMIVWGGTTDVFTYFNTGGRYNPGSDSWTATSTNNAPTARYAHTAVWTGNEMIIWGGFYFDGSHGYYFNTGGRYDPSTDSWIATSTANAPTGRYYHTAVWGSDDMVVWGGGTNAGLLNTGGTYNPSADSWAATNATDAPSGRLFHTAVWTGNEMIVWGGSTHGAATATPTSTPTPNPGTGGRYDPNMNTWTATNTNNAPNDRDAHTAVWTGSEMIVWGGYDFVLGNLSQTGGKYCAQFAPDTPTPTATATATLPPSPTPTATLRPSPILRPRPTPAPRP